MLTNDEKNYLKDLVKRELELFKKEQKMTVLWSELSFLKAEHEYGHFLEGLLEKLE